MPHWIPSTPARLESITFALKVTADAPGEREVQIMRYRPTKVREVLATDWTAESVALDPDRPAYFLSLVEGRRDASMDPSKSRELWISTEPPVEIPRDPSPERAAEVLARVRARQERVVPARVGPPPGSITTIELMVFGNQIVFGGALGAVPTAALGSWTAIERELPAAMPLRVCVRFCRAGTFVIAFRGAELS